jgi:hypothetical protein
MQSISVPFRRLQKYPLETRQRPESIGTLTVTESPIAIVVSALLIYMLAGAVPSTQPFFLGVLVFGGLTGLYLWRRHR